MVKGTFLLLWQGKLLGSRIDVCSRSYLRDRDGSEKEVKRMSKFVVCTLRSDSLMAVGQCTEETAQ